MHALTVRQPHAELIVCGMKTLEIRTWWPRVQLPMLVAIHAGKRSDFDAPRELWDRAGFSYFPISQVALSKTARWGGIIGVVRFVERIEFCGYLGEIEGRARWERLADQHLNPLDSWAPNKVGFRFEDPVRFDKIIPCRGRQGLWTLPEEVERLVVTD